MDKDRIAGSAKDFAGKVEGDVGSMAGDAKTQASGLVREVEGLLQNLYGQGEGAYENSAVAKKVEDNPLGALLVAGGGIGFALAMLMTRPLLRPAALNWGAQRWAARCLEHRRPPIRLPKDPTLLGSPPWEIGSVRPGASRAGEGFALESLTTRNFF
jgi:uncharacterized protein YjbJ (UPF0337 family)